MTQVWALYKVLVKTQFTKGRLILACAFAALCIAVAASIGAADPDQVQNTIRFLTVFGLGLMVPILSLVMASSVFGQMVEDETLVYLWMRPTPRWTMAAAAWTSAVTVALPVTVAPLAVAAAVGTGGDPGAITAAATAAAVATVAYTALFTFVGLLLRRALVWGLVYLFIWELFVARIGAGAARLSIGTYPASLMSNVSKVDIPLAEYSTTVSVLVPAMVAITSLVITTVSLMRTDVA